jgi:uncharacterized protein YjiK
MQLPHIFPSALLACAAFSAPLHAQLLLTEIQSDGLSDFWELTNVGPSAVDLSNYKWDDDSRNPADPAAFTIPGGTMINSGESIIFTATAAGTFRTQWGLAGSVQVIVGGPGFGGNDGVALFNASNTELFFFSYALNGFTRSNGSGSAGGHAGISAGGAARQAAIWDPTTGTSSPRYTNATGSNFSTVSAPGNSLDKGSPGYSGFGAGPSITLSLGVTPSTFSESAANPVATGTVTRAAVTASDLVVTLSSSDTTEATVPATVTILANQPSATFNVTAVDDSFPDGDKVAIITASAPDATAGTANVTVTDDGDVLATNLMLTEVYSTKSATAPPTADDFWELTNFGASSVSLTGYSWHDSGRSPASAVAFPAGSAIAAGESVIITSMAAADFRAWWGLSNSVQVFTTTGAPGLGKGDGVSLFEPGKNELFFLSYAGGGFLLENGSPSTAVSEHTGLAGGGATEFQSLIWVPSSGTATPRYTAATGSNHGSFQATVGTDKGSPGVTVGNPTVSIASASIAEGNSLTSTLALNVTRSSTATDFTVNYAVTGGSADGTDYSLASGMLTFPASGAATLPINITVNGDTDPENDDTVVVTLSGVNNTVGTTVLGTAVGTGTIINDDVVSPVITTQPASTTIGSGTATTLTVAASGFPVPTFQWYLGNSGDTTNPIGGATFSTFTTPVLTTTTSYWVRATNSGGPAESNTATVTVVAGATGVNLLNYVRVGRYDLPEYRRTALPPGTPVHNLLCDEASGVAYNWDTDTLFIIGDGGASVTQVSKTGVLIDTMTLALGSSPQGTDFYDPEGITYIGGGQFVFSEERDQQLVKFTYAAGTTLTRATAQTVDLGPFDDNTGTEGLSWDPPASDFVCLKELGPIGVFRTGVNFAAGTATVAPPITGNESSNLFNTSLLGMSDVADVFAFTNIPSMAGQPQENNLLIIGQENARILNVSRTGVISSSLQITAGPGDIAVGGMQHEGITMDRAGNIYVVNENGGGSIQYPQLWVYAPSAVPNAAPTAVALNNAVTSIVENTSTASPIKVGDIFVTDDGLGTNALSLTGTDAAFFEITGAALYFKAGNPLDFETKTSYAVTINADDLSLGATPDATLNFVLTVTDQEPETAPVPVVIISETAPWANSLSAVADDWFELTNISENTITITNWKVDDNSNSSALGAVLSGVTSIAPGESVIFLLEVTAAELAAKTTAFVNTWFGGTAPAGLQIGYADGGGLGLGSGGDSVNVFNASGVLQAKVSFGAQDAISPYQTFDNTVGANNATISQLSVAGVNGAFVAATSSTEIGSPGYAAPGVLRITEVAPWSSGNSPVAADWFEVTNTGARAVGIAGWKFDDVSESFAGGSALSGITSIAPGESVIFIQTADLAATSVIFKNNWFGANPPAGLQIGAHTGDGLGTGGDAVNLFDSNGARRAKLVFGQSPLGLFGTFDNIAALDAATVTLKSVPGVNGAFIATNSANEIGSPGVLTTAGPQALALWLSANGYSSRGFGADTDNDGVTDGVEFFFNQNPNNGAGLGNLPRMVPNAGALELDFTRLTSTGTTTGVLETSGDLLTWTDALPGIDYTVASSVPSGSETAFTYALPGTGPSAPSVSATYLTPNNSDPVGASLGGVRVINEGLVGVGRLSGESLDKFGETQGAASGLFITDWTYAANQFSGTFNVLPDRGHGDGTSNYAARLHEVDFTFTPYYGTTAVPQNQVALTYADSAKFTYQDGATVKFTTGLNPTGTSNLFAQTVGTITTANGPGGAQESLLSFDAEAVHLFADGSGFVSDEYGTYIARFNASKQITGLTQLPGAARPHRPAATPNFDSVTAPNNGRRNNQGLEGMSVSPDGTLLFAMLQSATVQDTNLTSQQTRNHARLFVYNVAGANRETPVLTGEYVVRLPQIDLDPNTAPATLNGTAAQSEIVALNGTSFLMLPRDGNGLGKGTTVPITYKSVQLVDFASATNILGMFDGVGQAVSPGGVLDPLVTAAATAEVINMLEPTDLAKFGLNTNTNPSNANTLNEKVEGMALVPDISTPAANDFFLFIANDNDFQSSGVKMLNAAGVVASKGDGRLNAGITNDAMFYVYRMTIDAGGRKFFRMDVTGNN